MSFFFARNPRATMRSLKLHLIALFQCRLYIAILADRRCTPDPPPSPSNLPDLMPNLYLNTTHWDPSFCGDWRWDDRDICVRVYCDKTSKNPLDRSLVEPVINEAWYSLVNEGYKAPFTDHTWVGYDATGATGFVLRIAEWEKRPGLLSNSEVLFALDALRRYWSGPPYEQSDFLIYDDGMGVIGGGSGKRPPRLGPGIVSAKFHVDSTSTSKSRL